MGILDKFLSGPDKIVNPQKPEANTEGAPQEISQPEQTHQPQTNEPRAEEAKQVSETPLVTTPSKSEIANREPMVQAQQATKNQLSDADYKNTIRQNVVSHLKQYRVSSTYFENKTILIWITDKMRLDSINNDTFKEDLRSMVSDRVGLELHEIIVSYTADIQNVTNLTEVAPDTYFEIKSKEQAITISKAKLTCIHGFGGATVKDEYILNSEEIASYPGGTCNIGRGNFTKLDNKLLRTNHIAIDDDPNSPYANSNSYISRSHAHITFSKNHGFILHVEDGGSLNTMIQRGINDLKLNNPPECKTLENGDIIILSGEVYLRFEII